jgi:hypothetical protein
MPKKHKPHNSPITIQINPHFLDPPIQSQSHHIRQENSPQNHKKHQIFRNLATFPQKVSNQEHKPRVHQLVAHRLHGSANQHIGRFLSIQKFEHFHKNDDNLD